MQLLKKLIGNLFIQSLKTLFCIGLFFISTSVFAESLTELLNDLKNCAVFTSKKTIYFKNKKMTLLSDPNGYCLVITSEFNNNATGETTPSAKSASKIPEESVCPLSLKDIETMTSPESFQQAEIYDSSPDTYPVKEAHKIFEPLAKSCTKSSEKIRSMPTPPPPGAFPAGTFGPINVPSTNHNVKNIQ